MGGFGVFTKCALKLYNWPGPPRIESKGMLINSESEVPENIELFFCFFPDREKYTEAVYRCGDNEIGYNLIRVAPGGILYCTCPHLFKKLVASKACKKVFETLKYSIAVVLAANCKREMDFQRETLKAIVRDNRGFYMSSSDFKPLGSLFMLSFLRASIVAAVFRIGGSFMAAISGDDTFDDNSNWHETATEIKRKWISRNSVIEDGGSNPFILPYENNTFAHAEEIYMYDPREKQYSKWLPSISLNFLASMIEHCTEPLIACLPHVRKMTGPIMGNYNHWQKQISEAFDPNGVSDSLFYTAEVDIDLSMLGEDIRDRLHRAIGDRGGSDTAGKGV